ncbi:MAG: SLC13 family permease [Defluviitaleaceae bacterium]|nr:SLC13 family permease [Defluviitaleaceae bacterium]
MGTEAIIALVILGVLLILFISDMFHIVTTSILACIALVVFGVIPFGAAFAGFSSDIFFLITGMMIVGNALFETGVAQAAGKVIISLVGKNEKIFLLIIVLMCFPISAFLTNTATVAMMLPVAAAAVAASKGKFTKKNTYMMVGLTSVSGGALTLVSSTPQLIAHEILGQQGYQTLGFFDISVIGIPIAILVVLYALFVAYPLQKKILNFPEISDETTPQTKKASLEAPRSLFKMTISAGVLAFCVIGFILGSIFDGFITPGTIALIGATACVISGCITQKQVFQKLDWTSVIVIGCSFGFANALDQSGAARYIAEGAVGIFGDNVSPWLLGAVLVFIAMILGNFMSNTATAALLIPIAIAMAVALNYNVTHMALIVAIGANISYSTPLASPALTMTLQGGYRFKDYIILGGLFNLLAFIVVVLMIPVIFMLV